VAEVEAEGDQWQGQLESSREQPGSRGKRDNEDGGSRKKARKGREPRLKTDRKL
jgi:hypothetical protein